MFGLQPWEICDVDLQLLTQVILPAVIGGVAGSAAFYFQWDVEKKRARLAAGELDAPITVIVGHNTLRMDMVSEIGRIERAWGLV